MTISTRIRLAGMKPFRWSPEKNRKLIAERGISFEEVVSAMAHDERQLEEVILASFERGEWRQVKNVRSEIDRHAAYAKAALAKDKRVNIRISSRDLEDLQAKAAAEGVAYQSLMSSVLHKYVTGRLVEPQPAPVKRGVKKRAG